MTVFKFLPLSPYSSYLCKNRKAQSHKISIKNGFLYICICCTILEYEITDFVSQASLREHWQHFKKNTLSSENKHLVSAVHAETGS